MIKDASVTKGELLRMVWARPVSAVAEEFGLSPNGLAKICDRLDIPRPPKGYWKKNQIGGGDGPPVVLSDPDEVVIIGGANSNAARRPRSRMSIEERRSQLLTIARSIVSQEGVHMVSLRRVAQKAGISEAQAHNVFSTREDLLVELALQEIEEQETVRLAATERGGSRLAKVIVSTLVYLDEVSRRGPLLARIMANSEIRRRVLDQRKGMRFESARKHANAILRDKSVSLEEAYSQLAVLTAMVMRSAHLVSENRIALIDAERLLMPVVIASALDGVD